ncbi:MAG: ATP-binding protein [Paludibacteraceae bacterium]|nr:ATP-binding protein [Paludibacteraceae bacterium]
MLKRKFTSVLEQYLTENTDKILLVNGARQIGKSYLIRYVGKKLYPHFVEINLQKDKEGPAIFSHVHTTQELYMQVSAIANEILGNKSDTLIFLDEIQVYPHLLTMLKFLREDGRYHFIASGSQLGIALAETTSVPMGSVAIETMYQLDFEEFLWANGAGQEAIEGMRDLFEKRQPLPEGMHRYILQQFQYYLLVGGLPDAVNHFVESHNMREVRDIHRDIHELYRTDASQYDEERKLMIRRIYDMIPSQLENRKKRIVYQNIEDKKGKHFADYQDEFEYLIESGITMEVKAVSQPKYPLAESSSKNLLKLYLNDVGLLTYLLYGLNINAVLQDERSINLGTVYESVVAQELRAHGFKLYYYDNKKKGEVDYLINDYSTTQVLPLEIKSGKDYKEHSALSKFLDEKEYNIHQAIVFSNEPCVWQDKGIWYMPIYYIMFLQKSQTEQIILPKLEMPTLS